MDWEVELVVVTVRRAERVAEQHAWRYVAGLKMGQDISERVLQLAWPAPQFSLGKSFPGFGPMGPVLATPDAFGDPNDLEIGCALNGRVMQKTRTSDMVFSVARLIASISAVCPMLPGDVIFTGTPAGVGAFRNPPVSLKPGDELVSWVQGIGELRNTVIAGPGYSDNETRDGRHPGADSPLDEVIAPPGFVMLGRDRDPVDLLSPTQRAVWQRIGGRSAHFGPGGLNDVEAKYAPWFEQLHASVVVIRPDFHIFVRVSDPHGADDLIDDLAHHLLASRDVIDGELAR